MWFLVWHQYEYVYIITVYNIEYIYIRIYNVLYYIITFDLTSVDGVQPWPPSDSSKNCKTYCQSSPAAKSLENFPAIGSYIMKFPQTERCNCQLHPMVFLGSQQQIFLQQIPSKQKTMKNPAHPTSSYRTVIFTANAQPLHVLIAALKTMISGRMPGEVSLCGYWTDSSMYCPCTEFSYTPNNLTIAICLGPWVLLKGNYKSSISFLLRSILLVSGLIHMVLVEKNV